MEAKAKAGFSKLKLSLSYLKENDIVLVITPETCLKETNDSFLGSILIRDILYW